MIEADVASWRPLPNRVMLADTIRIRRPGLSDAPALARLTEAAWISGTEEFLPESVVHRLATAEREQLWSRVLAVPGQLFHLVAELAGGSDLVGIATFGRPRFAPYNRWRFELYLIGVAPKYQRRGIGRALVGAAFVHMAALGGIGCCVRALEGAWAARKFYLDLGATEIAVSPSLIDGHWAPNVLFAWEDFEPHAEAVFGSLLRALDRFARPPDDRERIATRPVEGGRAALLPGGIGGLADPGELPQHADEGLDELALLTQMIGDETASAAL